LEKRERRLTEIGDGIFSSSGNGLDAKLKEIEDFVMRRLGDIHGLLTGDVQRAKSELAKHCAESRVSNSLTFMTAVGKQEFDLPGDPLIEEQFHFKVAVKLVLASSIAAIASALVTLGKSSRNSDSVRPCSR